MTARTCAKCGQPCDRRAVLCRACHLAAHGITTTRAAALNAIRQAKRARLAELARRAIDAGLDKEELSQ